MASWPPISLCTWRAPRATWPRLGSGSARLGIASEQSRLTGSVFAGWRRGARGVSYYVQSCCVATHATVRWCIPSWGITMGRTCSLVLSRQGQGRGSAVEIVACFGLQALRLSEWCEGRQVPRRGELADTRYETGTASLKVRLGQARSARSRRKYFRATRDSWRWGHARIPSVASMICSGGRNNKHTPSRLARAVARSSDRYIPTS